MCWETFRPTGTGILTNATNLVAIHMFRAVARRRAAGLVVRSCVLCTAFIFVGDAYEIYTTQDLTGMKPSQIWRPNLTEMPGAGSSQIWASQI